MKKLLLLAVMIVAPAWAEDIAVKPSALQATMDGASIASGVVIELNGTAEDVAALVADLEKEAIFKEAECAPVKESRKTKKISCAKVNGKLMEYLDAYASAKVYWSISGATAVKASCPTGCLLMHCPPPGGPTACCKRTPTGYKVCI